MADKFWGYHLLINGHKGNVKLISDADHVAAFVKELVDKIDMVAYGELWIDRFATHDPDKAGISFCQMIETSNITGHFAEITGDYYVDIFSCKPYDITVAEELCRKYFEPEEQNSLMVHRDSGNFHLEPHYQKAR